MSASSAVPLYPEITPPTDAGLPELPRLFDGGWVWAAARANLASLAGWDVAPDHVVVRQFSHNPGRSGTVSYLADWDPEASLPSVIFTCRLDAGRPPAFSSYPDDRALPGLPRAARADEAVGLVNRHVFRVPRRTLRVDMVRYRPGSRAVLRHRTGRIRLYVRVMRPAAIPNLLSAAEIVGRSEFAAPRVAGCWEDGGVVWLSEIPGRNVRELVRRRRPPHPEVLLDGLASLWALPLPSDGRRPFDLQGAYRRAKRTFRHHLGSDDEERRIVDAVVSSLEPFARSWGPSVTAHNDFYDDQMLQLPDGRVALVDFEEAGPGDPMLDVGNFLAHLRWASRFGRGRRRAASGEYYHRFRSAALDRHGWSERELGLREGICLFRVATNAIRRLDQGWRERAVSGLAMVDALLA